MAIYAYKFVKNVRCQLPLSANNGLSRAVFCSYILQPQNYSYYYHFSFSGTTNINSNSPPGTSSHPLSSSHFLSLSRPLALVRSSDISSLCRFTSNKHQQNEQAIRFFFFIPYMIKNELEKKNATASHNHHHRHCHQPSNSKA